jgi:hypothetical protein
MNFDNFDVIGIYGQNTAITSMTTNLVSTTPRHGEEKTVRIQGDGTARAITWGSSFTGTLLSTTVGFKTHVQKLIYDTGYGKWCGFFADTTGY